MNDDPQPVSVACGAEGARAIKGCPPRPPTSVASLFGAVLRHAVGPNARARCLETVAWLATIPATVLTQTLRDQDRAFANFFAKRAKYLRFKKRQEAP